MLHLLGLRWISTSSDCILQCSVSGQAALLRLGCGMSKSCLPLALLNLPLIASKAKHSDPTVPSAAPNSAPQRPDISHRVPTARRRAADITAYAKDDRDDLDDGLFHLYDRRRIAGPRGQDQGPRGQDQGPK